MKEISYRNMERILIILTKNATNDVDARWEIAERKRILRSKLDSVNEAREDLPDIKEYKKDRIKILNKYGVQISEDSFKLDIKDADVAKNELNELKVKYANALEENDKRNDDINRLLDKVVSIDIEPMKYEWFGSAIDSNDIEVLMELDMVFRT